MRHVIHWSAQQYCKYFSGLLFGTVFYLTAPIELQSSLAWAETAESSVAGDVVSVSGTVLLRSDANGASSAKMRTAKSGDVIYIQDVINTGSDGRIKVLMKDKSIIDLGPSALFRVDDFKGKKGASDREVEVSMVYGTMRAAVTQKLEGKGKFKVKTPSATMGVRGTEFVVKSEVSDLKEANKLLRNSSGTLPPAAIASTKDATAKGSTEISVLQGKVDVGKHDFNTSASTAAGRTPSSAGVVSLTAGTQISTGLGASTLAPPKTIDSGQMKAIATEAKVVDNTFQKAVVLEAPASNSSSSGSSGSGDSKGSGRSPSSTGTSGPAPEGVQKVLASTEVPLPPPPNIRPTDLNIPGAITPTQIFTQPAINTQGALKKLRIVISTN
jgi:hypothetical protein